MLPCTVALFHALFGGSFDFSVQALSVLMSVLSRALALVPCSVFCYVIPADPWPVPGNDQSCAHKHTQKSDGRGTVCMAQADTYMQGTHRVCMPLPCLPRSALF